jgi:hypothetical protein
MKKLTILFILIISTSCTQRMWVEEGINMEGILIWDDEDLVIVSDKNDANVIVYTVEDMGTTKCGEHAGGCYIWGNIGPNEIQIKADLKTNPVVIAHERGHHLGYDHNDSKDSIMYYLLNPEKSIYDFDEFSHLKPNLSNE